MESEVKAYKTTRTEVSEPTDLMEFAKDLLAQIAGKAYVQSEVSDNDWARKECAKIAKQARAALKVLNSEPKEDSKGPRSEQD